MKRIGGIQGQPRVGADYGIQGGENRRGRGMGKPQGPCGPMESQSIRPISLCDFSILEIFGKKIILNLCFLKLKKILSFVFVSMASV